MAAAAAEELVSVGRKGPHSCATAIHPIEAMVLVAAVVVDCVQLLPLLSWPLFRVDVAAKITNHRKGNGQRTAA